MRPRVCQWRGQSGNSLAPKGGFLSAPNPHHHILQMGTFPSRGRHLPRSLSQLGRLYQGKVLKTAGFGVRQTWGQIHSPSLCSGMRYWEVYAFNSAWCEVGT